MSHLAEAPEQMRVREKTACGIGSFQSKLAETNDAPLCADSISVLQVSIGHRCNRFWGYFRLIRSIRAPLLIVNCRERAEDKADGAQKPECTQST